MCFGSSKDEGDHNTPPRPASIQQQQQKPSSSSSKMNSNNPFFNPPQGTPPQHQQQYYTLPQGSPAQQQYAPPQSPPPQQQSASPQGPPPQQQYAPPQGPPPGHLQQQHAALPGPLPSYGSGDYAPPPGPPPSHGQASFASPSGPPPSHAQQLQQEFAPPPGPPPSHLQQVHVAPPGQPPSYGQGNFVSPLGPSLHAQPQQEYAPPPGPPPSHVQQGSAQQPGPPPLAQSDKPPEPWELAVPDTSRFPPPPPFFEDWDQSPGDNATEAEANAGVEWCAANPLMGPMGHDNPVLQDLQRGNIGLVAPKWLKSALTWAQVPGLWRVKTLHNTPDSTLISYPPLYHVLSAQPALWRQERVTVYYEVRIFSTNRDRDASVALGFSALPYPAFRLPGWHRASLAVHGDDGHRFVNDMWGGKSFTAPFRAGETLGLGMSFKHPGNTGKCRDVEVFFTRDGKEAGRWNLHEESDAERDLPVDGLEGNLDLAATIGVYKDMDFEVIFAPDRMLYRV